MVKHNGKQIINFYFIVIAWCVANEINLLRSVGRIFPVTRHEKNGKFHSAILNPFTKQNKISFLFSSKTKHFYYGLSILKSKNKSIMSVIFLLFLEKKKKNNTISLEQTDKCWSFIFLLDFFLFVKKDS